METLTKSMLVTPALSEISLLCLLPVISLKNSLFFPHCSYGFRLAVRTHANYRHVINPSKTERICFI
jgi:hypothetical protein